MTAVLPTHRLLAFNTATASDNKIHDDEVASKFGFTGGLVPGVDVYAYLCHPLLEAWGEAFFSRGRTEVSFGSPVYDGEEVEIRAEQRDDGTITAMAHTGAGPRAELSGRLVDDPPEAPAVASAPLPETRPDATPESLAVGTVLGTFTVRCSEEEGARYLADIRDEASPVAGWGVVHPGWILRRANEVLTRSVVLPVWIHVGSTTQHHRPLALGEAVTVRAVVLDNFERKGHLFVRADVVLTGEDGTPVCAIDHTAIYQPRQVRDI